jgi:hypothetical protein
MEAVIEITHRPDVIVAEVNGTTYTAARNVRWFGSLLERNNRAKEGEPTFETICSGHVLFGLESLGLLD